MKLIGLLTEDFSVYYDLVNELRERGLPFVSLQSGADLPADVGVIITTAEEAGGILHANVVAFTDATASVNAAMRILRGGGGMYMRVVIGIDPGERPGIAILADGGLVQAFRVTSPEEVAPAVTRALGGLVAERAVVRVGHGDPTKRDRILHGLLTLGLPIEIVDETRSTPATMRSGAYRDIAAAKAIALETGIPLAGIPARPRPSEGELRDIQRKSRIASDGEFTIGRAEARRVAMGKMTLEEAVQRGRRLQ